MLHLGSEIVSNFYLPTYMGLTTPRIDGALNGKARNCVTVIILGAAILKSIALLPLRR